MRNTAARDIARRISGAALAALAAAGTVGLGADVAGAEPVALTFTPTADTFVSSGAPTTSYGTKSKLEIDGSPLKEAYLKFAVSGIGSNPITSVKLRMFQVDSATIGGRVRTMSNTSWAETATWNTRPAVDGATVGQFGAVAANTWYEITLDPSAVTADGTVSLAIDSTNSNGADWASRQSANAPQLIVTTDAEPPPPPPPPPAGEGVLTSVAHPTEGSSDPTYYASNRRVIETAGGRTIAIHGRHTRGVQLAWRDAGSSTWSRTTQGAVTTGLLLTGTGTGDWPASIAVHGDSAWIVWSGTMLGSEALRPVQMMHLSDLDHPSGPQVDPAVTIAAPGAGNGRPDVAFERGADGSVRGYVGWVRRPSSGVEHIVVQAFAGVNEGDPYLEGAPVVLSAADSATKSLTLVETPQGVRVVGRSTGGKLTVWRHEVGTAPTAWSTATVGMAIGSKGRASAVSLDDGTIIAAVDRDSNNVVTVQRIAPTGTISPIELTATGYTQPSVTTDGTSVWMVMVRVADGAIVSRQLAGTAWGADHVEVEVADSGGNHGWPNTPRRVDDALSFIVRGARGSTSNSATAVLGYEREL